MAENSEFHQWVKVINPGRIAPQRHAKRTPPPHPPPPTNIRVVREWGSYANYWLACDVGGNYGQPLTYWAIIHQGYLLLLLLLLLFILLFVLFIDA